MVPCFWCLCLWEEMSQVISALFLVFVSLGRDVTSHWCPVSGVCVFGKRCHKSLVPCFWCLCLWEEMSQVIGALFLVFVSLGRDVTGHWCPVSGVCVFGKRCHKSLVPCFWCLCLWEEMSQVIGALFLVFVSLGRDVTSHWCPVSGVCVFGKRCHRSLVPCFWCLCLWEEMSQVIGALFLVFVSLGRDVTSHWCPVSGVCVFGKRCHRSLVPCFWCLCLWEEMSQVIGALFLVFVSLGRDVTGHWCPVSGVCVFGKRCHKSLVPCFWCLWQGK